MKSRFLVLALACGLILPGTASAADYLVDDDRKQCAAAQFTSIQAAVAAAALAPGVQSIEVCEGSYTENVSIGPANSVEIFGHGADKTFVHPVPGTPGPAFDAQSSGTVVIEKLTVDGRSLQAGGVVWGIRFSETNGRIKDTAVLNVRDATGASQGVAIRIQSSGAPAAVRVEDNVVSNYTRVGVNANGIGVETRIEDNVITGPVPPKVWAPNGIQVSRGAGGAVQGNRVSGSTSPNPPAGTGSGILLFCAGLLSTHENIVTGSDAGIAVSDTADAVVRDNEVRDSVFTGISVEYIGLLFGPLGCPVFPSPTTGNLIDGNKVYGSGEFGISLASFDLASAPSDNRITNNDVQQSGQDGIRLFEGTGNVIENNQMMDSGEHDAHDDSPPGANVWFENDCNTPDPRKENRPGLCDR